MIANSSRTLSASQVKRAERELCGLHGCACGTIFSTVRTEIEGFGNAHFEPTYDFRTGDLTGAEMVEDN